MSVMTLFLSHCYLEAGDTLHNNRNCETLSQSLVPLRKNPRYRCGPRRYDKRRHHIDRTDKADCVPVFLFSVLHIIQLSTVSSFILSNSHTFIHMLLEFDYYVNLQSSPRLKISGSFLFLLEGGFILEVKTNIKLNSVTCISQNSSVSRALQVWSKTGKMVSGSIPLRTTIYLSLTTFLLGLRVEMAYTEWSVKIQWRWLVWDN